MKEVSWKIALKLSDRFGQLACYIFNQAVRTRPSNGGFGDLFKSAYAEVYLNR